MITITSAELRSLLLNINTTTIVSLVIACEPRMNAKSKDGAANPFKAGRTLKDGFTIIKINKANGFIGGKNDDTGALYHRMVENRLRQQIIAERIAANLPPLDDASMSVEVSDRFRRGESWFRHLMLGDGTPSALVVHKDADDDAEAYLRFIFKAKGEAEYLRLADGGTVASDTVEPFLTSPSKYANQGLAEGDEVRFVVYSLASILEIALDGERYRIADNFAAMHLDCRKAAWQIAEEYLAAARSLRSV